MFGLLGVAWAAPVALQDGDLVFHRSRSEQSEAIRIVTKSDWTHVGVVVLRDGQPYVLEAIEPVSVTPLATWAKRAADGRIGIRRLADADTALTPEVRRRMDELGRSWLGRHYDGRFSWTDDQLYCSELVYKLFERGLGRPVGKLRPIGDFAIDDPRVAAPIRERFGGPPPADEPAVSPGDQYADPAWVTVCEDTVERCLAL